MMMTFLVPSAMQKIYSLCWEKLLTTVMLAVTEISDGNFLGGDNLSPAGANAGVHVNDEGDGNDDFESVANWRRIISITPFPGCSAFCPEMFVVLFETILV